MKDYIPIKKDTLLRFANEARRLGGTENDLSTEQMLEIFSKTVDGGDSMGIPTVSLYSLGFTAQEVDAPMQYKVIDEETYQSLYTAMSTGAVVLFGNVLKQGAEIMFMVGLTCRGGATANEVKPHLLKGTYSDAEVVYTLSLETDNPAEPTQYAIGFSVCALEQVTVDLTGYATEAWVQEGYQPKGEYLTAVPDGYAKTTDIPTKPEDIGAQPAGNYLTEVPSGYATEEFVRNRIAEAELGGEEVDLSGYLQKNELPTAIDTALAQAKASGEFDGKDGQDGYTPVKGIDYWVDTDKAEIVDEVLEQIPNSGGGSAIIDVVELPTENINENAFYRVLTGSFVTQQERQNKWICHCVDTLPETGDPAFSGNLADTQSVVVTAYYNVSDETVNAYVPSNLASMFGVPVGWYPVATLMSAVGYIFSGVITNILDDPNDDTFRLLLEYVVNSYKDGWTAYKMIGRAGIGANAETFNHPANIASGMNSHAEGFYSHAEGASSHAEGASSHAEGYSSHAEGVASHAEGDFSHAEGDYTHAEGASSHAEGASSHAEGYSSHAEGVASHAEGRSSHAEGYSSHAVGRSQHVQGEYNEVDPEYNVDAPGARTKYAHIVGNGTDANNRSNAHTLDWGGNAWFRGEVYVGGTGQDDQNAVKLATMKEVQDYVDNAILGGAW